MTPEQFEQAKQIAMQFADVGTDVPPPVRMFALCLYVSTLVKAQSRDTSEALLRLEAIHESAVELLERERAPH